MKSIKGIFTILTAVLLAGAMALSFSACDPDGGNDPCANGHDFSGSWLSDADDHWKVCSRTNCNTVGLKEAHDFDGTECTVCGYPDPNASLSSAKAITAFSINGRAGDIDQTAKTISVTLPHGSSVTSLTPTVTHTGESYAPTGAVDFTSSVIFTVTAENGSEQAYTVTVSVASADQHEVTFKNYDGTVLKSEFVNAGSSATAPTVPPREGYNFTGWDVAFTNVTGNLTITAQYTIKTFTVTFKDWNNTTLKEQTVNWNENATPPANPTRTGWDFTGWEGTYTNVKEDKTITAKYELISVTYTVTFYDWDNSKISEVSVNEGNKVTRPTDPIREGYNFDCWRVVTWLEYNFDTPITSNLVLYASYTIKQYTVTLHTNGGTSIATNPVTVNYGAKVATQSTTRSGYTFGGWYLDANITTLYNFDNQVTSNINLYAKWTADVDVVYWGSFIPAGSGAVFNPEFAIINPFDADELLSALNNPNTNIPTEPSPPIEQGLFKQFNSGTLVKDMPIQFSDIFGWCFIVTPKELNIKNELGITVCPPFGEDKELSRVKKVFNGEILYVYNLTILPTPGGTFNYTINTN